MFRRQLTTVVLAVAIPVLAGAAEPVKIEFKGWFSNPVFSSDGKTLVYARMGTLNPDGRTAPTQIILWDVSTGRETRRIEGPADDSLLGPIALSPDDKRLAIGLWNSAVRLWDLEAGKELARVENSRGARPLLFSPNGRMIAWLRSDEIYLASASTARELVHFGKEGNSRITSLTFVDGGKIVLTGRSQAALAGVGGGKNPSLEHQVTYWAHESATGKKLHQVGETSKETRRRFEGSPVHELFVSANGKTVLLAGTQGKIQVCDWMTGRKVRDMPVPWQSPADDRIRQLTLSGNGQIAALVTAKGNITIWDLAAGKELRRIEVGQSIDHVAISPDGKRLAVSHQTPGRVGAVLLLYGL